MPPENTPLETPALSSEGASPYLQELEEAYISSPVPDYAATLTTQADEDTLAHAENISFLRRLPSVSPGRSRARSERAYWNRAPYLTEDETLRLERENRRRLLRSLDMSRRLPIIRHGEENTNSWTSYTNRTPQRQSLYDWAPGSDDEDAENMLNTLRDLGHLNGSRENLPSYAQSRWSNWVQNGSAGTERAGRPNYRSNQQGREETSTSNRASLRSWIDMYRSNPEAWDSTMSLQQSEERHRRRAHARSQLQMYVMERDRQSASSHRDATSTRLHRSERPNNLYDLSSRVSSQTDIRTAYKQIFHEKPSLARFKDSIAYTSQLRRCTSTRESFDLAKSSGLLTEVESSENAILSPPISSVASSSWLSPGAVWSGTQVSSLDASSAATSTSHLHQRHRVETLQQAIGSNRPSRLNSSDQIYPTSSPSNLTNALNASAMANTTSNQGLLPNRSFECRPLDHWPVRITLHTVDLNTSTLTGTMEAYNIPDKTSPHRENSMKSYFDGEIIDFRNFGLETENFRSDGIETDTLYWRELGPFKYLKDDEIASKVLDKFWMRRCSVQWDFESTKGDGGQEENERDANWVLMRWKERSFLSPSPARWGLTISGFYYIAMHRLTGRIEGLYYDPGSQPYQQLTMAPDNNIGEDLVPESNVKDTLAAADPYGKTSKQPPNTDVKKWWPAYEIR
ncbi:MAG: hypothetical protein Q9160_006335 [Pyrenula sp. 1 TL-2023]